MEWRDVVYGPVESRRLGQSLGINLTPPELKVCNFNCGYCRVGVVSKGTAEPEDFEKYGWSLHRVKEAISTGLHYHSEQGTLIDYITIAGNGEPTLYQWFSDIVDHLIQERSRQLPDNPIAIFTNATKLDQENIKNSIYRLDRRCFKLDAGDEKTFRRINIPIGVTYADIIRNLLPAEDFELSVAVMDDGISNYDSFFRPEFMGVLRRMRFTKIFLYDIDIPKTTIPRFNRKTEKRIIEDLAAYLSEQLDIKLGEEIVILWEPKTREENIPLYPQQIG